MARYKDSCADRLICTNIDRGTIVWSRNIKTQRETQSVSLDIKTDRETELVGPDMY